MTTYVICGPFGYFADDVRATCAQCAAAIVHRPYVPFESVKLCIACGAAVLRLDDGATIRVMDEAVREASLYFQRTKGTQ